MRTYPGMPMHSVVRLVVHRLRLLFWWNVILTVAVAAALVAGVL